MHYKIPHPPNFDDLNLALDSEREAYIKTNSFSENEQFLHPKENSKIIFQKLVEIHHDLAALFKEFPDLISLFEKEYGSYEDFCRRDVILDLCLIDEKLFPETELFYVNEEGLLDEKALEDLVQLFKAWCVTKKKYHLATQKYLKEEIHSNVKQKDLPCQCTLCVADFRTRVRELIYNECDQEIEHFREEILKGFEDQAKNLGQIFYELQKSLDKIFHQSRFKLKKGTLNRLERQVKNKVKEVFSYPSELAKKQGEHLHPFFERLLLSQGLRRDLVEEHHYERFFSQLGTNLWRKENYLENEFKKLIRSILTLKRKDISANILKEYLGEFWIHSNARQLKRRIIYHMGQTNSGKTYHAVNALCEASKGCYLAPLRLLASELYDTLNTRGIKTTLLTGEEVIELNGATHYSSTIEMARFHQEFDCVVIDEIQMISDSQRGWAWTRALVNIFSPEIHICGDASVLDLIQNIVDLCNDTLEIKQYERMTDLVVEKKPLTLGQLDKSDALIVFSRRNALKYKSSLEGLGFKVSIVYGRLSPEVRREQARKFDENETDIIVSTDAIAMGMNLPIKRVVFSTLSKYIDSKEYKISQSEIKQIAGRAGRYQRYPTGYVNCLVRVENQKSFGFHQ